MSLVYPKQSGSVPILLYPKIHHLKGESVRKLGYQLKTICVLNAKPILLYVRRIFCFLFICVLNLE